eukprot:jgi/Ulvmu1/6181/UM028_0037.1
MKAAHRDHEAVGKDLHVNERQLTSQVLLIALTCCAYLASSSWLIMMNRFLMRTDGFAFPLTLSGLGMLFTWVATSILVRIRGIVPKQQAISRASFWTRIAPLGLCSAGTLSLGNMAYQYLDVAILEMLKSCCPVFVLLASIALRLERFTWPRFLSTCLIAAGIAFTAASGTRHVSRMGLALHLSSQIVEALRLCLAQLLMSNMQLHQFEMMRQMSSACVFCLGLGAWLFEWQLFKSERAWLRMMAHPHWYLAAASLGFIVNCSTYGVVKLAGPMTQKVLATAKTVAMVVLSCIFLGDTVGLKQWVGYMASLVGFAWYRSLPSAGHLSQKDKSQ